ncbi:MAG: lamin tail domain-containing protein [Clostridiaceae bacterium]|nr:lamin tail domain-containing protein [Eubacteriales bacterium]
MKARKIITAALLAALLCAALVLVIANTKTQVDSGANVVVINEVMSSNKGSVPDEYGSYPDWVELKNISEEEVDVGGLGLSDGLLEGAKYVIPSGTKIAASGFLVIYCSGGTEAGLYAPFRISSNEAVVLFDARGQALDSVQLRAVAEGKTLARDDSGNYLEQSPSPGYANDAEGIAAYAELLRAGESLGVYINEFMASNITTLPDDAGAYSDWIELYNATDAEVDLSGCGISDSLDQPMKYKLPEGTVIAAKGYLLIFCSGGESAAGSDKIHVPFSLRAYEEDVVLAGKTGKIVDSYAYARQEADVSMARVPDGTGEFGFCHKPTPGYPNTDDGYAQFTQSLSASPGDLYISEMMGFNSSAYADPQGEYTDWFEVHNAGSSAVNLAGYGVTNNPNNPAKWVFSDISVEPGGYLIVYASGLAAGDAQKKNQLDLTFSISAAGEALYLFDAQGRFLNKLAAGAFLSDVSCGRDESGKTVYYKTSTPGKANGEGSNGITAAPVFSTAPGIFENAISLEISVPAGETAYYTTDCTTPTQNSKRYDGPIAIDKNTVIRAVSVREGYLPGASVSGTYLFTSDGVNHKLPVATLVTDPDNLWDEKTGIYAYGEDFDGSGTLEEMLLSANYYEGRGYQGEEIQSQWERPGSFAIFNDGGTQVFSQNISMRIAGGYGRMRAQKGFTVIARSEYGSNSLAYPFFENRPYTEYKSLVLRAGAQDQTLSKIRDELSAGILEGTDVNMLYQAYKPYVLYLNGEYWGVYFLREKRSRFFVAQHENTENNDDVDLIKSEKNISNGSSQDWKGLMAYVSAHDLANADAYAYVESQVDMQSFMDYMICEIYVANTDVWNIQYYKLPGGKWKWVYYDFCWGWGEYSHDTLAYRRLSTKPCSDLFNKLLKNDAWRDAFLRRFGELMKTVYAPERVNALIDELYATVEPEIARERALFNAATFKGRTQVSENLASYDSFQTHIKKVRTFADKRPAAIKKILQQTFGLSDGYMSEVFG